MKDIISLDKESFYTKVREKYKKQYGDMYVSNAFEKIKEDDFHTGMKAFTSMILEKYLMYLLQFPKAEIPKENRKKKLNSLVEELKQMNGYDQVITNDVRKFFISELTKRTFEIPPRKLLDMYNRIFLTMNIEELQKNNSI